MFQVYPLPAFNDNYIWVISSPDLSGVAVVDPGDGEAVENYLKDQGETLSAILITHHHNDHTGGVAHLTEIYPEAPVYGPANSPFTGVTQPLSQGDSVELFGQSLTVQEVPAHTLDHISYYCDHQLFCGDTLFLAGCGRLFEGTATQMQQAMDYFKSLPDQTEVYCTHEYSLANLTFAEAVEPENSDIKNTTKNCIALRESDKPTLPSTIAQEKAINPFMRTNAPGVIAAAERFSGSKATSEVEVMTAIREWKNQF